MNDRFTMYIPFGSEQVHACNCIGVQPGHELCPCMERAAQERDRITLRRWAEKYLSGKPRVRVKAPSRFFIRLPNG